MPIYGIMRRYQLQNLNFYQRWEDVQGGWAPDPLELVERMQMLLKHGTKARIWDTDEDEQVKVTSRMIEAAAEMSRRKAEAIQDEKNEIQESVKKTQLRETLAVRKFVSIDELNDIPAEEREVFLADLTKAFMDSGREVDGKIQYSIHDFADNLFHLGWMYNPHKLF